MKGYWQSDVEMLARAFSCYVKDKLAALGMKSDYITAHSDIYTAIDSETNEIYRAYPYGEERQRINADFDALFE